MNKRNEEISVNALPLWRVCQCVYCVYVVSFSMYGVRIRALIEVSSNSRPNQTNKLICVRLLFDALLLFLLCFFLFSFISLVLEFSIRSMWAYKYTIADAATITTTITAVLLHFHMAKFSNSARQLALI